MSYLGEHGPQPACRTRFEAPADEYCFRQKHGTFTNMHHEIAEMEPPQIEVRPTRRTDIWLIASFSVIFLSLALLNAAWKPLWSDELFTFHIANLPTLDGTIGALSDGTDTLPPLFYVVTRASMRVFGANEIAVRLPAIFGFWLMCFCLFFIARKWSTPWGSAVAMLFPCITGAYEYAFEARPYGMVLGFSSLAFLCWQRAGERPRWLFIAGLGASLAVAVTNHYYAVLLWGAISIGELTRTWLRKRIDWAIWAALGAGALPLVFCLPFIRASKEYVATFWAKPDLAQVYLTYRILLMPALWGICGLFILVACFRPAEARKLYSTVLDQLAAAGTFAVFPVVGVLLGMLVTGIYTPRYTLTSVIGLAFLASYLVNQSVRRNYLPLAAFVMFGAFLMQAALIMALHGQEHGWALSPGLSGDQRAILRSLPGGNEPIAVASPHMFLELAQYAPPGVASRLHYLVNRKHAVEFTRTDSADLNLSRLTRWVPVRAVNYDEFIRSHPNFLVWDDSEAQPAWTVQKLTSDGAELDLRARANNNLLFEVQTR
jgi:hypothetical protein